MNVKNKEKTVLLLLISFTVLIINVINGVNKELGLITMILSTILDTTLLFAYIELPKHPIRTISMILIRQIVALGQDVVIGLTVKEALEIDGGLLLVIIIVLAVRNYTTKIESEGIKERIIKLWNYEKQPLKMKWWVHIIIYSMLVTIVATVANNNYMQLFNDEITVRIYGALAIIFPIVELIAILTTSNISYEIIIIYKIIQTVTIIQLIQYNGLSLATALIYLAQLMVVAYSAWMWIKDAKENKSKKKVEEA